MFNLNLRPAFAPVNFLHAKTDKAHRYQNQTNSETQKYILLV